MQTYALAGPGMLDPIWFNTVRHGQHPAEVAAEGILSVNGVDLRLSRGALAAGTAVRVWLDGAGHFVCATRDEIERQAQAWQEAEAFKASERRKRLDEMRADAEVFNARIALPLRWDVGIKDVLSGLSETSWGDGRCKATVEHIYLLEDLQAGRLKRHEGDFLCTSGSGTNGKRYSTTVVRGEDGDGNPFQPKVTCKACLAQAKRWMRD